MDTERRPNESDDDFKQRQDTERRNETDPNTGARYPEGTTHGTQPAGQPQPPRQPGSAPPTGPSTSTPGTSNPPKSPGGSSR